VRPCSSIAHLRNAAFTPVCAIPVVISETNISVIGSSPLAVDRLPRYRK
jgi:hypothetical protein